MAITAAEVEGARVLPRALAGATVLQIITALRDSAEARTAVSIARALVHAGLALSSPPETARWSAT